MPPPKDSTCWCWRRTRQAARREPAHGSRTTSASRREYQDSSTHLEEQLCAGEEVAVVGGGNSAGQAVVFLARAVRRVQMLVRASLAETMSRYLIRCIEELPNVTVRTHTRIVALEGSGAHLERVRW